MAAFSASAVTDRRYRFARPAPLDSGKGAAYAQGPLDAKLALTLELTLRLGEADARAISEVSGENTVITAWNNRLVALTRMGLLTERKVGKTKFYSPAVKGMSYGK